MKETSAEVTVSSSSTNCAIFSSVKMIIIKFLLLFVLYDGASSQEEPSQACHDITVELNANQACQQAVMAIESENGTSNATLSDLKAYCTQDCRDIVAGIARECVS